MVDKSITSLTAGTPPLSGTELVHLIDGGNSRKFTAADIAALGSPINAQTGTSYTLVATDRGKWVSCTNAAAVTLTVNSATFVAGAEITIQQGSAGAVTITAGAGVTIKSRGSLIILNGDGAVCTLKCITSTTFVLVGDLV